MASFKYPHTSIDRKDKGPEKVKSTLSVLTHLNTRKIQFFSRLINVYN